MSMILELRTINDATLDELLKNPESIHEFFETAQAPHESGCTDLDKAWHAIHYLLSGTAWEGDGPESFLLTGGQTIGDVDVGYGPARGLTATDTREVAAALDNLPALTLAARFNATELDAAEIYPQIWERDGTEGLDYVTEYYRVLQEFLTSAASKNMGILICLTCSSRRTRNETWRPRAQNGTDEPCPCSPCHIAMMNS